MMRDPALGSMSHRLVAVAVPRRAALIALAVHALFVSASLVPAWRAEPLLAGDAITYVVPARSILEHGVFSREAAPPFAWEPYRTPGFPLLIALSLLTTGSLVGTLYVACVSAGLGAWSAARLALEWGGSERAAWLAGVLVAVLPNSLGLSGRLLTDALFGHLFVFWVYLLWKGLSSGSAAYLASSAAICGFLQTVKPTLALGGLLVLAVAVATGQARRRAKAVAVLGLLTLAVPGYLACRNWRDHEVFATTLLGVATTRNYLMVRALAEDERLPEGEVTRRVRAADREAAASRTQPTSRYGRLYRVQEEKVRQFLRHDTLRAMRLTVVEAARQALAPQEFAQQLFVGELSRAGRAFGSLMTIALCASTTLGGVLLWRDGAKGPALLMAIVLGFFLATGSVSRFVGARLRFPADVVATPLAGIGLASLSRMGAYVGSLSRRESGH